jgi:acyl carrier protein
MNNFELVTQIVSKTLGISIENIKVESKFVEDLGGDSLDTVEMILELEDRLNIEVPEEVAENLDSVKKVVDYLDSL